jgi:DnaJ-class molecular chaperone
MSRLESCALCSGSGSVLLKKDGRLVEGYLGGGGIMGPGKIDYEKAACPACGGSGSILISEEAVRCGYCGGHGKDNNKRCPSCGGTGWTLPKKVY